MDCNNSLSLHKFESVIFSDIFIAMGELILPYDMLVLIARCSPDVYKRIIPCAKALYNRLNVVGELRRVFKILTEYFAYRYEYTHSCGDRAYNWNIVIFNNYTRIMYNKSLRIISVSSGALRHKRIYKWWHMGRGRIIVEIEYYDDAYNIYKRVIRPVYNGGNGDSGETFEAVLSRYLGFDRL